MKLLKKWSRILAVPVLVMVLCLFAAPAAAQIDPAALDKVQAAAAVGDTEALTAAANEAAKNGIENGMTIQEACEQIVFVALKAASASGMDLESAVRAAVEGVYAAATELGLQGVGQAISQHAGYGIDAGAEEIGLDEQTGAALKKSVPSFLPKIPEAPMLETPDIRDRSSGSPI